MRNGSHEVHALSVFSKVESLPEVIPDGTSTSCKAFFEEWLAISSFVVARVYLVMASILRGT